MKRIGILFVVAFLLLFSVNVCAAGDTYNLLELGLTISIPSNYYVVTRDTLAIDAESTTASEILDTLKERNIYLNAVLWDVSGEIVVTMASNGMSDFNLISDYSLDTLASALANQYSDYGFTVSDYGVYQHTQAKFVKIYFSDTANSVHSLQYYTTYNNKAMNFTMHSYSGAITPTQEDTMKSVVDSIKFNTDPLVAKPSEETSSFVYTDADTGVTFTVPKNWQEKDMSTERYYIDAKFVSTKEDGRTIIYGSSDIWDEMPASEKVGYSRKDFNNSTFTKSDIAEMYGTTADKISVVKYNGVEYFCGEMTGSSEVYGLDVTMTITQAVHINNGWIYMFQFSGTSDSELFEDFEELLRSVEYPSTNNGITYNNAPTNNNVIATSTSNGSASTNSVETELLTKGVCTLIVSVIAVIMFIVCKRKEKRADMQAFGHGNQELLQAGTQAGNLEKAQQEVAIYCRDCGQKLLPNSDFCHNCGCKIIMEDNT